ncbi:MAG: methionyl-tRNA formyltransferase [Rhodospirillaceae bacterium]|nr:methionyl-tRNA formyltransferase [Rhodospirillaceae bacterium]|tara:strand:- start:15855 stop:16766 length:912 start_codon:yes stop_codon:yes gene_type:complete
MRIVVNGMQAFGKAVVDKLVERGEEVIGVYGADDKPDKRRDPINEAAEAHGIPLFQLESFKTDEALDHIKSLNADLCVMAYVIKFVPSTFLNVPTLGSIQYHPSLLPKHRGPSSINWPIIQGSERTGLTIFWPDDGLDTGPVLLQKEVDIGPDDTLGSIYFEKLFPLGVDAMMEAVDLVRDGKAPKIVQDESQSTYESWCKKEDVEINWNKSVQEIYNMIRGANPQPGAWSTHNGEPVQIFDCRIKTDVDGSPGDVVEVSEDSFTIAANGGGIVVQRVRSGKDKLAANEYAEQAGIQSGAKFG